MTPIIEVEDLTKRYKKASSPAVDGISFEVEPGELFAFLGPNGAGKTTTISILTTTLAKTSGRSPSPATTSTATRPASAGASGSSSRTRASTSTSRARRTSACTSRIYGMYGYRPLYRAMPAEYRERVEELAEVVGLGDEIFKPLKTYSGGMKRKLEIIRSLMHRPARAVPRRADVRSGPGEPPRRSGTTSVRCATQDGTTIFLTTHYLDEAEEADRVCVIDHGKISHARARPTSSKHRLLERAVCSTPRTGRRSSRAGTLGLDPIADPTAACASSTTSSTAQDVIGRIRTPLTSCGSTSPASRRPTWRSFTSPRRSPHDRRHDTHDPAHRRRGHPARASGRPWRARPTRSWPSPGARSSRRQEPCIHRLQRSSSRSSSSGVTGWQINQNLGTALPYPYLPFMIIGMVANSITQGSIVASRTSSKSARTTSRRSCSSRRSRATRSCSGSSWERVLALAGLAHRDLRDDRRAPGADGRGRPAPGRGAGADPRAVGRRAGCVLHRLRPRPEDRRRGGGTPRLPADVPRPGRRSRWPSRRACSACWPSSCR